MPTDRVLPLVTLPDFVDLHRERFPVDVNTPEWERRVASGRDYDKLFTQAFRLYERDRLLAVYIPRVEAQGWNPGTLRAALHALKYDRDYRVNGLKIESATFGYLPRVTIRRDFCTTAFAAYNTPGAHAEVCRWAAVAEAYYRLAAPDLYALHLQTTRARVDSAYHLEGGLFTSGIVNHNSALHYHFDKGNYKAVWSAMYGFKQAVTGGYLVLPEFRMAAQVRDGSLFMFDGQGVFHGVTPFKKLRKDGRRFTVVYYSRQGMWQCESPAAERERIAAVKTRREHERLFVEPDPDFDPDKYPNRH